MATFTVELHHSDRTGDSWTARVSGDFPREAVSELRDLVTMMQEEFSPIPQAPRPWAQAAEQE